MKAIFLTLAIVANCVFVAAAQKSKKVAYDSDAMVVYTVGSNNNIKDGLYYVKNLNNDEGMWMQGRYKEGKRSGTWFFFNANKELTKRYSYDQNKLLYLNNDELADVDVKILGLDSLSAKEASMPVPLCSVDELRAIISNKALTANINEGSQIQLIVNVAADGKAVYEAKYSMDVKAKKHKIEVDDKDFKIDWLPSMYKGQAVESEFILTLNLSQHSGEQHRRTKWSN